MRIPSQSLLGFGKLFVSERRTVSFACAGAVGRTETDHRLAVDECRLVRFLSLFNGFGNCFDIVAVDRADDVPVIGFETFATFSPNQFSILPSMEIPLSSYRAMSLLSFQTPAKEQTS